MPENASFKGRYLKKKFHRRPPLQFARTKVGRLRLYATLRSDGALRCGRAIGLALGWAVGRNLRAPPTPPFLPRLSLFNIE